MVRLTKMGNEAHTATERALGEDRWLVWEWLRDSVTTIGGHNALREAVTGRKAGNILFEYLWFLLVVAALVSSLSKCHGPAADADDRLLHPYAPTPVIERVEWLEGGGK